MNDVFHIYDQLILPGEHRVVMLPITRQYMHTENTLPVNVVNGKSPGPTLFVSAAIHGDEIGGLEVIRRILAHKGLKRLRGTLLAVSVVNGFGFTANSRYLPDRRDLNRSFPGSPTGSLGARIAHVFMKEIVERSNYGIDLHTGANHRSNLPQIRGFLDDPTTRWLAQTFDVPVLINSRLRDGSLRQAAVDKGVPMLLYEAGEALRFDELSIRAGVRGVLQVMRALDMLPQRKARQTSVRGSIAKSTKWVRAPEGGVLHTNIRTGAKVRKGQILGHVYDPYEFAEIEVVAPVSGLVIGCSFLPTVNEGDALFHIASFDQDGEVAAALDFFGESLDPESNNEISDSSFGG